MQALVWLHMFQFRVIYFGTVQLNASYANLRRLHIFKPQTSGKTSSCIHVNMVIPISTFFCILNISVLYEEFSIIVINSS